MARPVDRSPAPATGLLALWRNPVARGVLWQVLVVGAVVLLAAYLVDNTLTNLEERRIRTGYDFLWLESGFQIGESVIPFRPADSYARAFLVGVLNTLQVAIIGIILATLIGIVMGVARLSSNWLVAKLASTYVETLRNIPLLLQLFFWYAVITQLLPGNRDALVPLPGFVLSKSGMQIPVPIYDPSQIPALVALALGIVAGFLYRRHVYQKQERTGVQSPVVLPMLGLALVPAALVFLVTGAAVDFSVPTFQRFNYQGGESLTPEFLALLIGLSLYTASFIAENVRSGIMGVSWGQTEASAALGLRTGQQLRLVILPQALRIIIPPTTSQFLNLTKNSSLAVAIGYPDLVSIANTSLNQTGQAIECISIMMAIYLSISLGISAFMNWYNARVALVER